MVGVAPPKATPLRASMFGCLKWYRAEAISWENPNWEEGDKRKHIHQGDLHHQLAMVRILSHVLS